MDWYFCDLGDWNIVMHYGPGKRHGSCQPFNLLRIVTKPIWLEQRSLGRRSGKVKS
jgi:hypothetical protein